MTVAIRAAVFDASMTQAALGSDVFMAILSGARMRALPFHRMTRHNSLPDVFDLRVTGIPTTQLSTVTDADGCGIETA